MVSHSNSTRAMLLGQERLLVNHISLFLYAQWPQFSSQGIVVKCTAAIFFLTVDCSRQIKYKFYLKILEEYDQIFYGLIFFVYHIESCERVKMPFTTVQISALVPEIFKFQKCVKYANEITDDIIHSTKYYMYIKTQCINRATCILAKLQHGPLKLGMLMLLQETHLRL